MKISFVQHADTFFVEELLRYSPGGQGDYVFTLFRKRNLSTMALKRRVSEQTGVPLKLIRHAGLKDARATAVQWLSWPIRAQREQVRSMTHFEVLESVRHDNQLSVGHVLKNWFSLILEVTSPEDLDALKARVAEVQLFPNYYGLQRFRRSYPSKEEVVQRIRRGSGNKMDISILQAYLFNALLKDRFLAEGIAWSLDDLWVNPLGKRWFVIEDEAEARVRFEAAEAVPSGPIYGFKTPMSSVVAENEFLAGLGLVPEDFRVWGKSGKGARRSLFVAPIEPEIRPSDQANQVELCFALPTGSYATVYLAYLLFPEFAGKTMDEWPEWIEGES